MIKCIHICYFSRLLFDADFESEVFFFSFMQIYIPECFSPTTSALRLGLKYLSLTEIKQPA